MPPNNPDPTSLLNDPEIPAEPVQPEAAIKFWQDKAKLTWAQAQGLSDGAKARAFYVTGLYRQDLVDLVSDALREALENGETLEDFKIRIAQAIQNQGWHDYRIENIFRTNMQSAYSAGRYLKMQAVKKSRPYWQYLAIMDRRTRPSHAVLHELVYPADHDFWSENYPPNGFRCRCCVRSLSERQVKTQDLKVEKEMPKPGIWTDPETGEEIQVNFPGADKGFRNNPFADWAKNGSISDLPGLKDFNNTRIRASKQPVPALVNNPVPANIALPVPASPVFAAKPVITDADLEKEIKRCVSMFTRNGPITDVNFVDARYFMATNSQGRYSLSTRTWSSLNNFCPAKDLKSAWNKIARGQPLTFNEEYCIESLWHETVHNRQRPTSAGANPSRTRTIMETVTQWVARRTYTGFLTKLGGNATHQPQIISGGYGYSGWIRRFDRFLGALGVKDEAALLAHLETVIKNNDRKKYQKDVTDYLFRNQAGKADKKAINEILKNLDKPDAVFESLLKTHGVTR